MICGCYRRLIRVVVAPAVVVVVLFCTPPAGAAPLSPLCKDGSYRRAHPLICDTGYAPGTFPGGGGRGGGGGLLDTIGDIVGGLTGGLL